MSHLKVYKSSAGSGKTFTLVEFYLFLVLQDPKVYKNILAITFTNKATWEMKERIIETLKSLGKGQESPMRTQLEKKLNSRDRKIDITNNAQRVLSQILHDYSRFEVSTIDSFFNKVIRAFSRELGLSVNFEVGIDQEKVLQEVTDRLMLEIGKDEALTSWLRDFAFDKIEDDRDWNIQKDIEHLGKELFGEKFQQMRENFQEEGKGVRHLLADFIKQLDQYSSRYNRDLNHYAKEVIELVNDYGLRPQDFSGGDKSVIVNFQKILANKDLSQGEKFLKKFKKLDGPEKLAAKNSDKRDQIVQCAEEGLFDLLETIAEYLDKYHAWYLSIRAVKSHIYAFGILTDLEERLKDYRKENELLLIPDINNLLRQITNETDSPFIYEKVGQRYSHFLIDEFQDTSDFQWDNLKPLVINALANRNRNLIVGDVKQSIYRWRGGNPDMMVNRLYNDLDDFRELIKAENLNTNFRSFGNLVAFNNHFFNKAIDILLKETDLENPDFIAKAYGEIKQQALPENGEKGFVHFQFKAKNPDLHFEEEIKPEIMNTLEDLFLRGFQYQDIAILVRTNAQAKDTAQYLASLENPIPVISSDGLSIGYSTAVRFLVNLLYYLHDPSSPLVHTYLLNDYLRYFRDANIPNDEIFNDWQDQALLKKFFPDYFFQEWEILKKLPLYELGERLIQIFGLEQNNDAYIQRFLDLLLDFTNQNFSDLNKFLDWWEEKGKFQSVQTPLGENAVRLETIHKAKGLEYPVVLMPYASWDLNSSGKSGNNLIWVKTHHDPFTKFPFLPVSFSSSLDETIFQPDYQKELMLTYLDNINLLYVGLTRAVEELFVFAPDPRDKKGALKLNKVNALIYQVFLEDENMGLSGSEANSSWVFEKGEKRQKRDQQKSFDFDEVKTMANLPSKPWQGKLAFRSRSNEFLEGFKGDLAKKKHHGLIVHGILEKIRYKDDLRNTIDSYFFEGLIENDAKASIKNTLEEILKLPHVAEWFSEDWAIMNEREILMPDGTIYRPDRVITKGFKAKVIEYKTGQSESQHKTQVKKYGEALHELGYEKVEKYILYLEEKRVVPIE